MYVTQRESTPAVRVPAHSSNYNTKPVLKLGAIRVVYVATTLQQVACGCFCMKTAIMFALLRLLEPFLCMMPLPSLFSLHIHTKGRQYLQQHQQQQQQQQHHTAQAAAGS